MPATFWVAKFESAGGLVQERDALEIGVCGDADLVSRGRVRLAGVMQQAHRAAVLGRTTFAQESRRQAGCRCERVHYGETAVTEFVPDSADRLPEAADSWPDAVVFRIVGTTPRPPAIE